MSDIISWSKIQGSSDRVTLGMFFGIQNKSKKIFSWAWFWIKILKKSIKE